jgi:hypothetical protein
VHTFIDCAYIPHLDAQLESEEVMSIAKVNLADIAEADVGETLSTNDLLERVFTINSVRKVNGSFGETYVGELTLDGDLVEAWLSGNVVFRQLSALEEAGEFPRENVTLVRDADKYGEPFVLKDA